MISTIEPPQRSIVSLKFETLSTRQDLSEMDGNKWLFDSPEMSDIRFLVDGETVYGHKVILAMGSPVFEVMFFGQLKEKRGVIEIKDLTPLGFKNALR